VYNERFEKRMAEVYAEADRRVQEARKEAEAANEQTEKMANSLKSLNNAFKTMRADDNQACVLHPLLQRSASPCVSLF
jgi:hypothetical protein